MLILKLEIIKDDHNFVSTYSLPECPLGERVDPIVNDRHVCKIWLGQGQAIGDASQDYPFMRDLHPITQPEDAKVMITTRGEAACITGQSIVVDGGQIFPESLEALEDI